MSTTKGRVRPKGTILNAGSFRHARSIGVNGKVGPRCNARKNSKLREDLIVTGNDGRVTCEACRRGLS